MDFFYVLRIFLKGKGGVNLPTTSGLANCLPAAGRFNCLLAYLVGIKSILLEDWPQMGLYNND